MRSTEALPRFACPDWWDKIQAGRTPMPAVPLNEARAAKALAFFNRLRLPDVAGNPRLAEACGDWFRDISALRGPCETPQRQRGGTRTNGAGTAGCSSGAWWMGPSSQKPHERPVKAEFNPGSLN
jgi:hypothetical protein